MRLSYLFEAGSDDARTLVVHMTAHRGGAHIERQDERITRRGAQAPVRQRLRHGGLLRIYCVAHLMVCDLKTERTSRDASRAVLLRLKEPESRDMCDLWRSVDSAI